jgi:hypothetical protein
MVEAERDRRNLAASKAKIEKATGMDSDLVPHPWPRDYIEARNAIIAAVVNDEDGDEDRCDRFHDHFHPLHDRIMEETAQTPAGLAVHPRAFTLSASDGGITILAARNVT